MALGGVALQRVKKEVRYGPERPKWGTLIQQMTGTRLRCTIYARLLSRLAYLAKPCLPR